VKRSSNPEYEMFYAKYSEIENSEPPETNKKN
jgi:hypothetical protein